jgi:hypothetical protein
MRVALSELFLRERTLKYISEQFECGSEVRIVEELGLSHGESRIDIAVINGKLIGFEIKSDHDDLKRLPTQLEMYEKYFDQIWIVTTEKHLPGARMIASKKCGLLLCKESGQLIQKRMAKSHSKTIPAFLLRLIWKDEARSILLSRGVRVSSGLNKEHLYKMIEQHLDASTVRAVVRNTLIRRQVWRSA